MKNKFVETELNTIFGCFNIQVYYDHPGKETVVLSTKSFNPLKTVLVRLHSECMTGDVFGSMHCDCREQLLTSLKQINESENGLLIYLRQEGRGIGLYEKIKSYQLQAEGIDTHEANLKLGHPADARQYDFVKTVFDNFGIKDADLLTNNPLKVRALADLGYKITRRSLVIPSNKHNNQYLSTKEKKFRHSFSDERSSYFYSFPVDISDDFSMLSDAINAFTLDPHLKLCGAIPADKSIFFVDNKIEKLQELSSLCRDIDIEPVLHFSFGNSDECFEELIKRIHSLSLFNSLQLNDLHAATYQMLKVASQYFQIFLPLTTPGVRLLDDECMLDLIKEYNINILLDNSQGKGKEESFESYQNKIDVLLGMGINNITLCGGFGPDNLEVYFKLVQHYGILFSIDAETNLKTKGKVDMKKINAYLLQLLHTHNA